MSFRKVAFWCAVLVGFGGAGFARAQAGVYGTVTGERVGGFTCHDPQGVCASNDGKERPYGGTFGGYYDFRSFGRVRFGADVRGNILEANKSAESYMSGRGLIHHYNALGGLRASFMTPIHILHPYAEVAGGYAKYVDSATTSQNYTQVEGLVGLDVVLLPYLDVRAIELGAGEFFGPASHGVQSIGAGLVFHLPR